MIGPDRLLHALPVYLGGKRKLAQQIFRAIKEANPKAATSSTLLDPFAGACSISAIGKLLGYRVIANDTSLLSEAVGKALIENSSVQLERPDVELALSTDPGDRYLPPVKQLLWPDEARELITGMARAADEHEGDKRWLLRALTTKTALTISMWGLPRMTVGSKVRDGRWDDLTTGQANALHYLTEPRAVALRAAEDLYGVVFTNGRRNEMHRSDVLDFLATHAAGADVAYLDPPYPGVEPYEANYGGLEGVLANGEVPEEGSRFSARQGWRFLEEVFEAAAEIPLWVLSLGNEAVTLEPLVALMEKHGRQVEARAVSYTHLAALSTAAKNARNEEYLLIGRVRDAR